ncbi:MAG: molybdopterin-dependent oxidoreductase [Chloroflexota bacterium]|nr:molybdopterin-dependent oxidoreductase [Chloroflexota bacterium]
MATRQDDVIPDFLRMDDAIGSDPANANKTGNWHGWPTKDLNPVTLMDDAGRTVRIRTPVMDLEGLITPTDLHYTVQHFDVPPVVPTDQWELKVHGQVKNELTLNFDQLRRFPGRSVRTVMECSGSDATFFEYFKDEGPKPSRTQECMILSASEWTGVPLAAVLNAAGLDDTSLYVRAIGNDEGVPATAAEGTQPFYYDKGLPMQKALHPDTILAYAQNGQLLEHLHGAPVRLLVPGWSGNWSVKWITDLEIMDHMPECWYHYEFYYYGNSADDPNKELITTLGVKSIVTQPNDDVENMPKGTHMIRGYAWSGAGAISEVDVSTDGGDTWHSAHIEAPRHDQFMWVRWSYRWDANKSGNYTIMARASDDVGRVQSREPRYNNMRKNFSAIVGYPVTVK